MNEITLCKGNNVLPFELYLPSPFCICMTGDTFVYTYVFATPAYQEHGITLGCPAKVCFPTLKWVVQRVRVALVFIDLTRLLIYGS